MYLFLKSKLSQVLHSDQVRRIWHTAWQAAGSALIVSLLAARSSADVKAALIAAGAVALAALKAAYLTQKG